MNSISLQLPWPPSNNRYWRHCRGRNFIGADGLRYRKAIGMILSQARMPRLDGRLSVAITALPPDRRKRDLDNLPKAIFDSLQQGGLFEDDSQIDYFSVLRSDIVKGGIIKLEVKVI